MAPLKSLEKVCPIIDSNFQSFCSSHGIFSVEDFLIHDLYVLAAFAEQQPASEKLKQGITQILSIIDAERQPWMNGLELLEDARENKHVLSTGCEGVDTLLGGGLREGQLTEIVGPSSSGKTQVCLRAASNVATKYNAKVFYLDTGNSFSPQRISGFVNWKSGAAFDRPELLELLMALADLLPIFCEILYNNGSSNEQYFMPLCVRHFHNVRRVASAGIQFEIPGHALMISAGSLLKKIAHEYNIAVLVTNHTVGGDRGTSKPALGESWKSVPHVRLQLSRDPGSNVCQASILKHSSMASDMTARFVIYE